MFGIPVWTCPDCGQTVATMYMPYHRERLCPGEPPSPAAAIDKEFSKFMESNDGKFMQYLVDQKEI